MALATVATDEDMIKIAEKIQQYNSTDPKDQTIRSCLLETLVRRPEAGTSGALLPLLRVDADFELRHQVARAIGKAGLSPEVRDSVDELVAVGERDLLGEVVRTDDDAIAEPVSALSIGEYGWVQRLNFVVLGVLLLVFAGASDGIAPVKSGIARIHLGRRRGQVFAAPRSRARSAVASGADETSPVSDS